ncbi:hypothetical protein [Fodinibius salsisoli]|uniref:LPP20 lipoprotein n=1 Tax=Fodinibius salsisoli TaxID=2820877 RepID=A0ABT3PMQ8_9BACT|nr:hypothetical protein [Fodinibius salsisoli]MCW9706419.1 hypothetical protein [Fodinibius salsisoli]
MNRLFSLLTIIVVASAFAGCSSTSQTVSPSANAQNDVSAESQSTPTWFNKEEVAFEGSTISSYATAIGPDSVSAVSKAVERASVLLRQSVSNRLESVRNDALKELGSDSGLDTPGFLIALRKADRVVNEVANSSQTNTQGVEGQSSSLGFAEVQADRAELIERMGEQLSAHQEAWNSLVNSDAFSSF